MEYKRTAAWIDLDALDSNIKNIKKLLPEKTEILGILKADGYGHGALKVYEVLRDNGVTRFSVACLEEALSLRKNGMTHELVILGFTPAFCAGEVVENNLTQTISSLEEALILEEAAAKAGKRIKVHIKVDTGMTRLGFCPVPKAVEAIEKINGLAHIEIEGIFTHFAVSDIADKTFTLAQKQKFLDFTALLEQRGISIALRHCSNSGAVIDTLGGELDLVRPGIITFGLYPSEEVDHSRLELKPVMSIKTQVAFVREIEEDTTISYGRTYRAPGKRKIAALPIGYADGYSRLLSNRGHVLIHGQKAPIVGTICMDQCMVDVTGIDGIKREDEVVVMGSMGGESVTAEDIASLMGTISYEVVCAVNKRVPRIYVRNGEILQ